MKNRCKYKNKYHAILNCDYPVNSLVAWIFCVQLRQANTLFIISAGYRTYCKNHSGKQTFLNFKKTILCHKKHHQQRQNSFLLI